MPLDASNSFATLVEANAYHDTRLHNAEWSAASDDDKEKALMWATRLLDAVDWAGGIKSTAQALAFPRVGLYDKDGRQIDSDSIPQFLINATAELAWLLIINDSTRNSATEGFKKIKVAVIELEIDNTVTNRAIADSVASMIKDYVSTTASASMVGVARG